MELLEEDAVGSAQTPPDLALFLAAFDAIKSEGGNNVIVGTMDGRIVATYQITVITGLSHRAVRRAQIEGVRVSAALRGQGIGAAMMRDADSRARAAGCTLMQLSTHASRSRAHHFYESLGFTASHVGYKRTL